MLGICFQTKNRLEIVPLTTGKRPEIRSKMSDFTCKAFWGHFWPPVGPPRPPQGDPRRPKAAQGWASGRARLRQGPHFGTILGYPWVPRGRHKATQDAPRPPKDGHRAAHGSARDPILVPFSNQFASCFRAAFWDQVFFDFEGGLDASWPSLQDRF